MSEDKSMNRIVVLGSGCGSLGQRLMNEVKQKKVDGKRITASDIEKVLGIKYVKVNDLNKKMESIFPKISSRRDYKDFTKNSKHFLKCR